MVKLNVSIHPSLSEMITESLRRRNVITIVDFVAADPIKLATFTGLSHTDISQVKQHILKKFNGVKRNATELFATELVIPTNIMCLDRLLKGGLYPGQLCELCGLSFSGKTQLCLMIVADIVARSKIAAWYFDTKRDFSRLRYEEILKTKNFKQKVIEDTLQRTKVCHVRSSRELIQALRQLVTLYKTAQGGEKIEDRKPILVIIDSLPAVIFRVTRDTHQDVETIYELDDLAEVCRFLTRECQAIVITVNSITRWDSPGRTDSAALTPALGKYWARVPVTRLLVTRRQPRNEPRNLDETRKITVWKDLRLDENSFCIVNLSNAGIVP